MLLLASQSPRRSQLLETAGYTFKVAPAEVDETRQAGELPQDYVRRLALIKARAAWNLNPDMAAAVGADTTVAIDDQCLGKPHDKVEAAAMLSRLSGRTHHVYTGFAVLWKDGLVNEVVDTSVTFRNLNKYEIENYIASGEPFDKAGSYAIQGLGGMLIEGVNGSYTNVIGLPLSQVIDALKKAGIERRDGK